MTERIMNEAKEEAHKVSATLPWIDYLMLKQIAGVEEVSVAEIIRKALDEYYPNHIDEEMDKRDERRKAEWAKRHAENEQFFKEVEALLGRAEA